MSQALLASLLLPAAQALQNRTNAQISSATSGSDTGQTLGEKLVSDLTPKVNRSTPVGPAFPMQSRSVSQSPISTSSVITPLQVPTGSAAPAITDTPTGPKVLWQPDAAPDYSSLKNPLLDSWTKGGVLPNPNGFTHYESSDKSLPFVGPNYLKNGASSGYWYDPFTDKYYENPNSVSGLVKAQGAAPKTPSLLSQLLPTIATIGAGSAASALGKSLFSGSGPSLLSQLFNSIGGSEGGRTLDPSALLGTDPASALNSGLDTDFLSSIGIDTGAGGDPSSFLSSDTGGMPSGMIDSLENTILGKLGANEGTKDVANLTTDFFSGNWPQFGIHAVQDAPTLLGDAVNEGGNIVSKVSDTIGGLFDW